MTYCAWDQQPVHSSQIMLSKKEHPSLQLEDNKFFCSLDCKEQFISTLQEVDGEEREVTK